MSNFIKFTSHLYWAKNQNGFNNSLYDYFSDYPKLQIKNAVQNFPIKYPTTFIIINQMFECSRIYIEIVNIEECNDQIKKAT